MRASTSEPSNLSPRPETELFVQNITPKSVKVYELCNRAFTLYFFGVMARQKKD